MSYYQDTLKWMFSRLPFYQRKGAAAYRPGLDSMNSLDLHLGHPHKSYKTIHIAGTNGKGSTSHMIASILQTAGYKTGLYTSPHLLDFRERIKINGEMIPESEVTLFIDSHKNYFETQKLSFFEMTVGMAFSYFKKEDVDFAVIEVGLGGRLDATNIIMPILSVITNIGLDHTQFLGTTRPQIAAEKAGIIKNGITVVVGKKDPLTDPIFQEKTLKHRASLIYAEDTSFEYKSDLKGAYQKENIKTATVAIKQLSLNGINKEIIQKGLKSVITNTNLLGRWQLIYKQPRVIFDVGHNKEGLYYICKHLRTLKYKNLHLVMGFVIGRDVKELISLFPSKSKFYLSAPDLDRAFPIENLKLNLSDSPFDINYFESIPLAYKKALNIITKNDLLLVCGSTFVVAEVLALEKKKNE